MDYRDNLIHYNSLDDVPNVMNIWYLTAQYVLIETSLSYILFKQTDETAEAETNNGTWKHLDTAPKKLVRTDANGNLYSYMSVSNGTDGATFVYQLRFADTHVYIRALDSSYFSGEEWYTRYGYTDDKALQPLWDDPDTTVNESVAWSEGSVGILVAAGPSATKDKIQLYEGWEDKVLENGGLRWDDSLATRISATRVFNELVIGIPYRPKTVSQWALRCTVQANVTVVRVLKGFGYVAPDGSLTGLTLPAFAVNGDVGLSQVITDIGDFTDTPPSIDTADIVHNNGVIYFIRKKWDGLTVALERLGDQYVEVTVPFRYGVGINYQGDGAEQAGTYVASLTVNFSPMLASMFGALIPSAAGAILGLGSKGDGLYGLIGAVASATVGLCLMKYCKLTIDIPLKGVQASTYSWAQASRYSHGYFNRPADVQDMLLLESVGTGSPASGDDADEYGGLKPIEHEIDMKTVMEDILEATQLFSDLMRVGLDIAAMGQRAIESLVDSNNQKRLAKANAMPKNNATQIAERDAALKTARKHIESKEQWDQFTGGNVLLDADVQTISKIANEINSSDVLLLKSYAEANAQLLYRDFFSVGPDSAVAAGPGFVQAAFDEQVATYSNYAGSSSWVAKKVNTWPVESFSLNGTTIAFPASIAGIHVYDDGEELGKVYYPHNTMYNLGDKHVLVQYPTREYQRRNITSSTILATKPANTVQFGHNNAQLMNKPITQQYVIPLTDTYDQRISYIEGVQEFINAGQQRINPIVPDSKVWDYERSQAREIVLPSFGVNDFCVNPEWKLYFTALNGQIVSVTCDDTRLFDGAPSNVLVTEGALCLASPSGAMVKLLNFLDEADIKPRAITPDIILYNNTGLNATQNNTWYHACDGYSSRILYANSRSGVGIEHAHQVQEYISPDYDTPTTNIYPAIPLLGDFMSFETEKPTNIYDIIDGSLPSDWMINENMAVTRLSMPITAEVAQLQPPLIRQFGTYPLIAVNGKQSLTTDVRQTMRTEAGANYTDCVIQGNQYRVTSEFLSRVTIRNGVTVLSPVCSVRGLQYVGYSTEAILFYSPISRTFYNFTGSESLQKVQEAFDLLKVDSGVWDYTTNKLLVHVLREGYTTTDVVKLDDGTEVKVGLSVGGHQSQYIYVDPTKGVALNTVPYPNETIGPHTHWCMNYGVVFQGASRCQLLRILPEDMNKHAQFIDQMDKNRLMWYESSTQTDDTTLRKRIKGDTIDDFWVPRSYGWKQENDVREAPVKAIDGFFHEGYRILTSYYHIDEFTDYQGEWMINFVLSKLVRDLWDGRKVKINFAAEALAPDGKIVTPVSHLWLAEEQFGRNRNGIYTYRFISNLGSTHAQRLYIWSDGVIEPSQVILEVTEVTTNRMTPAVLPLELSHIEEF